MKTFITLFAFVLCSCTPSPVTPPGPDASDASSSWDGNVPPPPGLDSAAPPLDQADAVCLHLVAIGCAQPPTCAATIRSKNGTFTNFNLPCLLSASSKAAAISCGTVKCP